LPGDWHARVGFVSERVQIHVELAATVRGGDADFGPIGPCDERTKVGRGVRRMMRELINGASDVEIEIHSSASAGPLDGMPVVPRTHVLVVQHHGRTVVFVRIAIDPGGEGTVVIRRERVLLVVFVEQTIAVSALVGGSEPSWPDGGIVECGTGGGNGDIRTVIALPIEPV